MAKERTGEWRPQAMTGPRLRPAWRELAVQQWLLQTHARLEIQSALASRMRDYANQLQQRIRERQAWIQQQLVEQGRSREGTQPSGKLRNRVFSIMDNIPEGTLSPQALNAALMEQGEDPLSPGAAQGYITHYLLTKH